MEYIYKAVIKEVGDGLPLTPIYIGEKMTRQDLINFFGLNEPDVEWFRLYQVIGKTLIPM